MLKVISKVMGTLEVDDRQKILLPDGLLGYESFKEFVLLDSPQNPFFYLQSLDNPNLSFILIDPFIFRHDYNIDIDDDSVKRIGVESPEEVLVFAIVTALADGSPPTANLLGPLLINKKNRTGFQAVLSDSRWKVKHDIVAELEAYSRTGNQN